MMALILALAATSAAAQSPGNTLPRSQRGPSGGVPAEPMRMGASVAAQVHEQLAQLEEDLRLTPAQRGPWKKYAANVEKLIEDVVRARSPERFPKGTALQQFDQLGDTARNRLTAVEEIIDAGRALYALLDPRQQELADRRLARVPLPLLGGNPSTSGTGGEMPAGGPPGGPAR
jgi:hypothetical protein